MTLSKIAFWRENKLRSNIYPISSLLPTEQQRWLEYGFLIWSIERKPAVSGCWHVHDVVLNRKGELAYQLISAFSD